MVPGMRSLSCSSRIIVLVRVHEVTAMTALLTVCSSPSRHHAIAGVGVPTPEPPSPGCAHQRILGFLTHGVFWLQRSRILAEETEDATGHHSSPRSLQVSVAVADCSFLKSTNPFQSSERERQPRHE